MHVDDFRVFEIAVLLGVGVEPCVLDVLEERDSGLETLGLLEGLWYRLAAP